MHKFQLLCAGIVVLLPAAAAETTALRTGLWELTFKSAVTLEQARRLSRKTPPSWLQRVPSAQRAEVERQYSSGELLRNALNTTTTLCITEDDLVGGIRPGIDIDQSCTLSRADIHRDRQHLQLLCAALGDEPQGNAQIEISVHDPQTLSGKLSRNIATTQPFDITVELHGSWLDSQCGEDAPEEDETPLR